MTDHLPSIQLASDATADLYLQLLVGLHDSHGNRYSVDDVKTLAAEYGFGLTAIGDASDPAVNSSPLISKELLGIWRETAEPSVLFLVVVNLEQKGYAQAVERFRALVADILRSLNQEAVFWFPAVRRSFGGQVTNLLLRPAVVRRPEDLSLPEPTEIFGRQVFKTLPVILGPQRAGQRSILVYRSRWVGAPLFIPNFRWTPPYGNRDQLTALEQAIRERYPPLADLLFDLIRDESWRSSRTKPTGDQAKARKWGPLVNYTFQFALAEGTALAELDPDLRFTDRKEQQFMFRTLDEMLEDPMTCLHNWDVIDVLNRHLGTRLRLR